jgi:hypothetical protein
MGKKSKRPKENTRDQLTARRRSELISGLERSVRTHVKAHGSRNQRKAGGLSAADKAHEATLEEAPVMLSRQCEEGRSPRGVGSGVLVRAVNCLHPLRGTHSESWFPAPEKPRKAVGQAPYAVHYVSVVLGGLPGQGKRS